MQLNSRGCAAQDWAFEAREFLRSLAVGKEITFTSSHALASNDDVPRDLGNGEIGGLDIATELLRNGWAKLKELKREPTEDDLRRKDIEAEAKAAGRGVWNPHGPKVRLPAARVHSLLIPGAHQSHEVIHNMPLDSHAYITEWRGKTLDGVSSIHTH